ncbi:hypothetical protein, conserved [Eimeria acervulina]|uniref:Uncharacterized protein n=1 Tax=Eimeria acervulina TaxID=5801 RepID=U6GNR2_EIMAC|nr:hypothetical protein, conserved [Eimeria acervulina]CDI81207.1 hypothetical protein, conserved [Eimeria acervulina]
MQTVTDSSVVPIGRMPIDNAFNGHPRRRAQQGGTKLNVREQRKKPSIKDFLGVTPLDLLKKAVSQEEPPAPIKLFQKLIGGSTAAEPQQQSSGSNRSNSSQAYSDVQSYETPEKTQRDQQEGTVLLQEAAAPLHQQQQMQQQMQQMDTRTNLEKYLASKMLESRGHMQFPSWNGAPHLLHQQQQLQLQQQQQDFCFPPHAVMNQLPYSSPQLTSRGPLPQFTADSYVQNQGFVQQQQFTCTQPYNYVGPTPAAAAAAGAAAAGYQQHGMFPQYPQQETPQMLQQQGVYPSYDQQQELRAESSTVSISSHSTSANYPYTSLEGLEADSSAAWLQHKSYLPQIPPHAHMTAPVAGAPFHPGFSYATEFKYYYNYYPAEEYTGEIDGGDAEAQEAAVQRDQQQAETLAAAQQEKEEKDEENNKTDNSKTLKPIITSKTRLESGKAVRI